MEKRVDWELGVKLDSIWSNRGTETRFQAYVENTIRKVLSQLITVASIFRAWPRFQNYSEVLIIRVETEVG